MEVKGDQESRARADGHDRGGPGRNPGRGRAKVTVRSDRRRGIMVEAEHEDIEHVYQGQVDVLLKSYFLTPPIFIFPWNSGVLSCFHS